MTAGGLRAALLGRYRGVSVLCVVVALNSFGMGAIAPVLPLFLEQEYGVSAAEIGITIGLFGFGRLVTSLPAGYLAQRYGRKSVLGLGAAINVLGAAMVSVSFSYAWLTGWRFVSGFGGSIFLTVATIYLRDEATPETRGRLLSLQELSILAGQTLGPVLGGYMADIFGLRVPLYVQAILMAVSLGVIVFALPESRWREEAARRDAAPSPQPSPTRGEGAGSAMVEGVDSSQRDAAGGEGRELGAMWRLMLSPAFIFVGMFALMIVANRQGARFSVMPLFGREKGFEPDALGLWISVTHFPQFFTTLASGYLSDRFGRKTPIIPAITLLALGIGTFVWADNLWQLLLSGVLLGMGEGLGSPAGTVFFADIAPPGMEGVTIGLLRTFGGVGTIVGALALGAIADWAGFSWALWIDAGILAASALGLMLFVRETRRVRRG
ncbi:MAG: MFS transporter [Chloroflexota bacterium]|nr:MFS transporter [Chloroflexota bacterium]MDE2684284.1 MFS transporter [Chloroflexota bacterium]